MKSYRKIAQKIRASTFQSGRVVWLALLLVAGLAIGLTLVSCDAVAPLSDLFSGSPAEGEETTAGESEVPGTAEFGMTMEELVTKVDEVEALIAQCMNEAGFEYIAADFDTVREGMLADKSLPGMSEEEFIAEYGYGISTLYTGLDPQLADATNPAKIGLGERNVQIYNDLSPADQVAYNRTLLGENTDATFAVTLEAEDFSRTGGCTRAAIEQVFTPEQLSVNYANPLDFMVEQDPRMVTALEEFAACIREEGFDYNHPDEAEEDIRERLEAISGGLPPEALSADAQAALIELQGEERAIAAVAFDCEEEIVAPVEEQILSELHARQDQ
jgi:hypothetical protein